MAEDDKSVSPNETNHFQESIISIPEVNFATASNDNVNTNSLDPEVGNSNQENANEESSENTDSPKVSTVNSAVKAWLSRISFLPRKLNLISHGNGQQVATSQLNALSTCAALTCLVLLCLYIVRGQATDLSPMQIPDQNFYRNAFINIPIIPNPSTETVEGYSWMSVEQLLESSADKSRLYIKVTTEGRGHRQPKHDPEVHFVAHNHTLKISGRPDYCTKSDSNTPKNVVATHVTHLHLSEMDNCHNYVKLILAQWQFPQVRHVKLHKMLVREQEFHDLTKFIDRHNHTLHRVEIDECFMCPSPICDAGFINFPDHDFQITITRRRESPDWL